MDAARFDALARRLTTPDARRRVLQALGGLGLAGIASRLPGSEAEAKKRRKPKTNQFGCIDVGKKCYGKSGQCCSGICEGSKKKSKCVAHNVGTCTVNDSSCDVSVPCGVNGECFQTTGKAAFCAEQGRCFCDACKKDKDCEADFGLGAACIVCATDCINVNGSRGTACVPAAPVM